MLKVFTLGCKISNLVFSTKSKDCCPWVLVCSQSLCLDTSTNRKKVEPRQSHMVIRTWLLATTSLDEKSRPVHLNQIEVKKRLGCSANLISRFKSKFKLRYYHAHCLHYFSKLYHNLCCKQLIARHYKRSKLVQIMRLKW